MSDRVAKNSFISKSAKISKRSRIIGNSIHIGDNVFIGDNVHIEGNDIFIDAKSTIGNNVVIKSDKMSIGFSVIIENDTNIKASNGNSNLIKIGDFSFLGFRQNILLPELIIGDYTTLHNSCLLNGYKRCSIGHNCWIGQSSILNATEELKIGNNVRIGTQSQLWTHIASGELLEGCNLYGEFPLTIEDDVWIVGGAVISPNLILRKKSVIMVGSVVTKSTLESHCYAGVPAIDVTNKISPYHHVSLEDKVGMMKKFIAEFQKFSINKSKENIRIESTFENIDFSKFKTDQNYIIILVNGDVKKVIENVTIMSLETKKYTKNKTSLEIDFIKFNLGFRARFIPL